MGISQFVDLLLAFPESIKFLGGHVILNVVKQRQRTFAFRHPVALTLQRTDNLFVLVLLLLDLPLLFDLPSGKCKRYGLYASTLSSRRFNLIPTG